MRYTPFESMERMFDQMRRDMSERRNHAAEWSEDGFEWPGRAFNADLTEHDGTYVLAVDMPGFETDEIDLVLDGGYLTLSAVHSDDETASRSRSISERIALPKEIVEDDTSATYHNGVLEVHLPIAAGAEDRGHRIDVD